MVAAALLLPACGTHSVLLGRPTQLSFATQTRNSVTKVETDDPKNNKKSSSPVPYVATGTGVALGVATSVAFGLLANGAANSAVNNCRVGANGDFCEISAVSDLEREQSYALVSDVGLGVAIASGIGLLIYALLDK